MGIHQGHRERMRERFLKHGLDNFDDHNVLEMLLFYSVPRRDTNPIAHELLERFGSLAGVLEARPGELMKVDGVGEGTAALLNLIPQLARRYGLSRSSMDRVISSTEDAGRVMLPYFTGETGEAVYVACLDAKRRLIDCRLMDRGGVGSISISIRKIVEYALSVNAAGIIVAHNHPSGIALPSKEDREATRKLMEALRPVEVALLDHLVISDEDFVSMAEDGLLKG